MYILLVHVNRLFCSSKNESTEKQEYNRIFRNCLNFFLLLLFPFQKIDNSIHTNINQYERKLILLLNAHYAIECNVMWYIGEIFAGKPAKKNSKIIFIQRLYWIHIHNVQNIQQQVSVLCLTVHFLSVQCILCSIFPSIL